MGKLNLTPLHMATSIIRNLPSVEEQGTSGIWTYRKWSDGTAECWASYTATIAITTSAPAYGGYRSAEISAPSFPFTFTTAPTVIATANSATGYWINNVIPHTTYPSFFLSAGASLAATNRTIGFYVIGKWK